MRIKISEIDGAIVAVRCVKNRNVPTRNFTLGADDIKAIIENEVERIIVRVERGTKILAVIHDVEGAINNASPKDDYFLISYKEIHDYVSQPGEEYDY